MKKVTYFLRFLAVLTLLIGAKAGQAQCGSGFNFTVNANGFVTIANTSTISGGTWVQYDWTFGNGTSSVMPASQPNATGIYTINGTYSITLIASGTTCTSTITRTVSVTTVTGCTAAFTYTPGAAGTITCTSTSANPNPFTIYTWQFFGGSPSYTSATNLTQMVGTYTNNGVYTIFLQVANAVPSCTSTVTRTIGINNLPCNMTANFIYNQYTNGVVIFTNTSTGIAPATASYNWDFGTTPTSTSNVSNPVYTYTNNGTYTVNLNINNGLVPSCISNYSAVITVTNACNMASNFVYTVGSNSLVTFTSTATGTNVPNSTYEWQFTGGSPNYTSAINLTQTAVTFTNTSVHYITLTLYNTAPTCTATITQTLLSCNLTPTFFVSQLFNSNGRVDFYSATTGTTIGTSYSWNFNDGSPNGTGSVTSHTYTNNGTYTVTLTANNNVVPSCSSSYSAVVTVTNVCNLNSNFVYTTGPNASVTFTSTSTGTNVPNATYYWQFAGGVPSTTSAVNLAQPGATFTSNGPHTVVLYLISAGGTCSSTATQTVNINNFCNLNANFASSASGNGAFVFTNSSTNVTGGTTYLWNFGDGSPVSTNASPTYTYANAGNYTVTLIASNNTTPSCISTRTAVITATINCNLVPGFAYTLGPGGIVTFSSTSTGTTTATVYNWYYGNSALASGTNLAVTSQTYTNGTYTVTFNVHTSPSCSLTINQTITVTSAPPVINCNLNAGFTYTINNGIVDFTSTSTGTTSGASYSWNFGTGAIPTGNGLTTTAYYSNNQVYTVTLVADNNLTPACTSTYTALVAITGTVCNISPDFVVSVGANGLVTFTNTSTNSAPTPSITWDFYDNGSNMISGVNLNISSHTYTTDGVYTVWLSVFNIGSNCTAFTSHTFAVTTATTCSAAYSHFTAVIGNGGVVIFNPVLPLSSSYTYLWNYGDASTGSAFAHTYAANGIYTATLTATNNTMVPVCTSTFTQTFNISPCNLVADYTYTQGGNGTINFNNTSTGTRPSTTYLWNFGDGVTTPSATASPVHTYSANGTYTVILTANTGTCTSQKPGLVVVTSVPIQTCNLAANFTHTVGAGGFVNYLSNSTGLTPNVIYNWDFGDGHTATGNPAAHTYVNGGAHNVLLWLTDPTILLCNDSIIQSVNITGIGCNANAGFTLEPTPTIHEWSATPFYPWNVISATWDWGDGSSSNSLYTSHTYSAASNYSICLTVVISCGDTAVTCAPYYLNRTEHENDILLVNVVKPVSVVTGIKTSAMNIEGFSLYPNPNNGTFSLLLNEQQAGKVKVSVYSIVGSLVYEEEYEAAQDPGKNIDMTQVLNGVYFITVNTDGKTYTKKIIVNR